MQVTASTTVDIQGHAPQPVRTLPATLVVELLDRTRGHLFAIESEAMGRVVA
jgi:hypothetical protein